jgi:hypothetical protein
VKGSRMKGYRRRRVSQCNRNIISKIVGKDKQIERRGQQLKGNMDAPHLFDETASVDLQKISS